ncbi:MAG: MFS transporter [Sphingomonadales bacterium]
MALGNAAMIGGHIIWVAFSGLIGAQLAPKPGLATLPLALVLTTLALSAGPISALMGRHGRRAGFYLGAMAAIASAALALVAIEAGSFTLLCIAALLQGPTSAAAQFFRFAAAELAGHARASKAVGFVLFGHIIAALSVPPLVAATGVLAKNLGYAAFGAAMIYGVLALLPPALLRFVETPPAPVPAEAPPRRRWRLQGGFLRRPFYWVGLSTAAFGNGAMSLLMAAAPLAMVGAGHATHHSTQIMQYHIIAMFLPSLVAGWLIARLGLALVIGLGILALASTVAISMGGMSLAHFGWGMILLGIGWNFTFVAGTTIVARTHDAAERGAAQGLNDSAVFGTAAFTSLAAGGLIDSVGWQGLNLISAVFVALIVAANVAFYGVNAKARQRTDI